MCIFLIPFISSIYLVFFQDIFVTFVRDYSTNFIGVYIKIGIYWFSYDIDFNGKIPYKSSTMTYWKYCAQAPFKTRFSNGEIIDYEFFCNGSIWKIVQYVQGFAILAGCIFIFGVFDNLLVWQGLSKWYLPAKNPNSSVRKVRKFFKIVIQFTVLIHFILQLIVLYIIYNTYTENLIKQPDGFQLNIGFYGSLASCLLDIIFLAFFTYSDQLIFFHQPFMDRNVSYCK